MENPQAQRIRKVTPFFRYGYHRYLHSTQRRLTGHCKEYYSLCYQIRTQYGQDPELDP